MENITAILLDTVSIQKYVFAGNRLKENLGASVLVRNIFGEVLSEAVQDVIGEKVEISTWSVCPEKSAIEQNKKLEFEVGYIGGGNALLFFGGNNSTKKAKTFVSRWSEKILVMAPGLSTAVAIKDNFDFKNIENESRELYKRLAINKNRYFPVTKFIKHGISRDCTLSDGAGEIKFELPDEQEQRLVSWEFFRKNEAANENPWSSRLDKRLQEIMDNRFYFPDHLDKLGQVEGSSHIAVVHIDGNNMSQAFACCKTLAQKRQLSLAVAEVTETVVAELVKEMCAKKGLIDILEDIHNKNRRNSFNFREHNKTYLPFRPIILEGDDITFITDGRLGIYLAVTIMKKIEKCYSDIFRRHNVQDLKMSTCAGVVIVKTKYPFYRVYTLAEELCAAAKRKSRDHENTSWLDFYVVNNSFAGSLENIRKKYYAIQDNCELTFGPYLVCGQAVRTQVETIANLLMGIEAFSDPLKWPRNKTKKLRELLAAGRETVKKFNNNSRVELELPQLPGCHFHEKVNGGWDGYRTPYIDMLDLLDFYPLELFEMEKRLNTCESNNRS